MYKTSPILNRHISCTSLPVMWNSVPHYCFDKAFKYNIAAGIPGKNFFCIKSGLHIFIQFIIAFQVMPKITALDQSFMYDVDSTHLACMYLLQINILRYSKLDMNYTQCNELKILKHSRIYNAFTCLWSRNRKLAKVNQKKTHSSRCEYPCCSCVQVLLPQETEETRDILSIIVILISRIAYIIEYCV